MAVVRAPQAMYAPAVEHLECRPEQVGFFLAEYDTDARAFDLRAWRGVPRDGLDYQSDVHVELSDAAQAAVIQWAWESGLALVEAHSHRWGPARFSGSDFAGFADWVPHVRWRLRRRPYAALVLAPGTLDGLAWIDAEPERVDRVVLGDRTTLECTGLSTRDQGAA
jgi:hypothetical protein